MSVAVGNGSRTDELEELLSDSRQICECAHSHAGALLPGGHFLSAELISNYDLVSCPRLARWIGYEEDIREGKTPFYLCEVCASFWREPPFQILMEPLC